MAALDSQVKHVLVRHEAAKHFTWYQWGFSERWDGQTWVELTPPWVVQMHHVAKSQFTAMVRGQPCPQHAVDYCFWLDPSGAMDLADAPAEARQHYGGRSSLTGSTSVDKSRVWVLGCQQTLSEAQPQQAHILKQVQLLREEKASGQPWRMGKNRGKGNAASANDAS